MGNEAQYYQPEIVTIVIPAYNVEKYIRENIESLINQSYKNLEIIYICDGCTDQTVQILCEYTKKDPRVILKIQEKNQGAALARNIGMNLATGEWIIFLDADDIFDLCMIKEMIETAWKSQADIVGCYWECFDEIPNKDAVIPNEMRKWYCKNYPIIETVKELPHIMQITDKGPCTKLVSKSIYTKKDVYFQNIPNANDVYYSISAILNSNRIAYIDKAFLHYRSDKGRKTLSTDRMNKKNYILEAYHQVYGYINSKQNNKSLLQSFYNDVILILFYYLEDEVYNNLFTLLKDVYLDKWQMNKQGIFEQLNEVNKILYNNILNNNRENNRNQLLMKAKIKFVKKISKDGCSIWGIGKLGCELLKEIEKTDIDIQHVYDSAQTEWGRTLYGHVVEKFQQTKSDNIIITTPKYFDDIKVCIGQKVEKIYNLEQQIWMIPDERNL